MAEHVSQERSDEGEQSSMEQSKKQQVGIQREIKIIFREIKILKERLANMETQVTEIIENRRNVPPQTQDKAEPLPEL